jgi:hypothetical protein
LVQVGVRAIPVGIAALSLAIILKPPGTQAGAADSGLLGSTVSVFGTIHPGLFRLPVPLGSAPAMPRLQLASLEPQIGVDARAHRFDMPADTSTAACGHASDERLAFDARPAASDKALGFGEDCPASFHERFTSATPAVTLASLPAESVQQERPERPKSIIARARSLLAPARKEAPLLGDDGRTAIYDITAHTVYLPGGRRLEAHSGLGNLMDDPRHTRLKMRGPTPPNIYNLTLRERIFHGVRAIRLNPVDEERMHGRDGILAHTYMLGGNGQSNGCVAFRNYSEFLDAFTKGEITRLAVVDRLETPPGKLAAGQLPAPVKEMMKATERRQYAAADER